MVIAPTSDSASAPVLSYSRGSAQRQSRWLRVAIFIGALPGVVCPFVSFTYDTSPLAVVERFYQHLLDHAVTDLYELFLVAAPFFLGILISARQLRHLLRSPATLAEHIISLCVAAFSVSLSGYFLIRGTIEVSQRTLDWRDLAIIIPGYGLLVGGVCSVIVLWLLRFPRDVIGTVAMNTAYLTNAGMCLGGFIGNYETGAWLALITSVALIAETIASPLTSQRLPPG